MLNVQPMRLYESATDMRVCVSSKWTDTQTIAYATSVQPRSTGWFILSTEPCSDKARGVFCSHVTLKENVPSATR